MFSSKIKVDEIWLDPPQPAFPSQLIAKIKVDEFESELMQLIEYLKESILKRK
jgi:hypothetical protein